MPHTTNFAAPANTQPTYQRGPQTHPKPIDSTNKTSSPLSQALAKIHAHNSCQQRFRRLPRTHQRAPGPPPASPTTSGSIQPCSEGRLHTFDQHSQNGVGSRVEEEMDTIEPPSFCPSLGFTAASTERTESVGVVRGLLLWPSSLRPSVCSFSVRADNQSTAHPC